MRHGVACGPGEDQAKHQQRSHGEKKDQTDPAIDAFAYATARNGSNGESCHTSIVAGPAQNSSIKMATWASFPIAGLPPRRGGAQNGGVRARMQFAALAVATLFVCLAGMAQNQDRDTRGVPKTSVTAPPPEARIDINHASVDELLKIPGMTRVWAARIGCFPPHPTHHAPVGPPP